MSTLDARTPRGIYYDSRTQLLGSSDDRPARRGHYRWAVRQFIDPLSVIVREEAGGTGGLEQVDPSAARRELGADKVRERRLRGGVATLAPVAEVLLCRARARRAVAARVARPVEQRAARHLQARRAVRELRRIEREVRVEVVAASRRNDLHLAGRHGTAADNDHLIRYCVVLVLDTKLYLYTYAQDWTITYIRNLNSNEVSTQTCDQHTHTHTHTQ